LGQFQYTANYQKALERQAKWQHALGQVFEKVDFIALPTLQEAAAKIPLFGGGAVFEAQVLGLQNTEAVNSLEILPWRYRFHRKIRPCPLPVCSLSDPA
jgi:Asp-tRNA(Asn)/Glu-tRNA(Gln) amidotransferase A subunit family amidase